MSHSGSHSGRRPCCVQTFYPISIFLLSLIFSELRVWNFESFVKQIDGVGTLQVFRGELTSVSADSLVFHENVNKNFSIEGKFWNFAELSDNFADPKAHVGKLTLLLRSCLVRNPTYLFVRPEIHEPSPKFLNLRNCKTTFVKKSKNSRGRCEVAMSKFTSITNDETDWCSG